VEIHERIKARRLECGLSVDEVAAQLGVSRATVYRYESAEIKNMGIDKITPLAGVLKISPIYLMGWTDDPENYATILIEETPFTQNSLPPLTSKDERSIQKRLQAILDDLAPENSAMAYFDDEEPMSEEDKELLRISLENTLRTAKQLAKQKYTPKKYRK